VAEATKPDLARLYMDTHERLHSLVAGLDDAAASTNVPACPRWSVHDVLAHLAATAQDAVEGRLTGPPSEEETAVQVGRLKDQDLREVLALWVANAPTFSQLLAAFDVWPGVVDVASHEQDIRGALGLPGARDTEVIQLCADNLLSRLDSPVPLRVLVEDAEFRVGPEQADGQDTGLSLRTSRFDAFRWRMGRRSRAQLVALDWSDDPTPLLDHLVVFGPAASDIIE
jgi:uncharacterized protein (TIGR03083 family)